MNTASYCQWCGGYGEFFADQSFLCQECHAAANGLAIAKPFAEPFADEDQQLSWRLPNRLPTTNTKKKESLLMKTSFGTLRDFASASGYSHSYYRQTFEARSLSVLGRTIQRQGSPLLRCTPAFLSAAKRHAAEATRSIIRIDQNGQLMSCFKYVDLVEFEVDSSTLTATVIGYQIGRHWLTLGEEFDFYE